VLRREKRYTSSGVKMRFISRKSKQGKEKTTMMTNKWEIMKTQQ
jgi:hypothetical protein